MSIFYHILQGLARGKKLVFVGKIVEKWCLDPGDKSLSAKLILSLTRTLFRATVCD